MKIGNIDIPPKEEFKKLKSVEELKKEEASDNVLMDQDFYDKFKLLENIDLHEDEDNTEYFERVNKEYEIKSRDDLFKYIKQFEDDQFVSPVNFKKIADMVFRDDELFNKLEDKLSYLLRTSIDEESMIEGFIYEDLTKEEENKEWEKVDQNIDSYIEKIFSFYDQGDFQEKLRIINFLRTQVALTLFNNNSNTISRIKYFLNNRLEKEKGSSGNHYICLHLESLLDDTEDNFYPQILPGQFITKEYIDKIEDGITYLGEGGIKFLISDVKDFDKLKILLKKRIDLVKEFRRMKYSYPEYENLGEQISLTIKEISKYFTKTLEESNIACDKSVQDYLHGDFDFFSNKSIRDNFTKNTSIQLEEVSIKEQCVFFDYTKNVTNGEMTPFYNLLNKYDKSAFRTFLSIEQGGKEMGDKILILGEKLPESSARILFKTYGEMIDASEEVGDILKDNLKEKATPEIINRAKESLLINGKDLLDKYSQKAKECEGQICEDIGKELEERLSLAKKSVFAFSAACKVLVEKGEFSFEDFKKAKLSYDQSPIPEDMREKIIRMHDENTKQYPDKLKNIWRGTLKDGLINPNPNQLLVSASYEDEVVSAMRVIKREDGSWYGASFNVNPTIQGGRIGTELLKEVLKDLAKDKPFVADCYSKNLMLSTYLNKFGFKITKEIENYHDTGELVYEITLSPEDKKEI